MTPQGGPNQLLLHHPAGVQVLLMGTQHVATTHASRTSDAIAERQPHSVCIEVDAARFQQLEHRMAAMLHASTHGLMTLTNSSSSSSSSDGTHASLRQRFKLARAEGVPLLLGSLYGADFLQAALAAATAVPGGAEIILADIPQQQTLSRFRALTATRSLSLGQVLAAWLLPAPAQAEALGVDADPRSRLTQQQAPDLQQLAQVLTAAAQLAAGRLVHHLLLWASMACSSAAQWYGEQVHPVFLLVADPGLPDRLAARGCAGTHEAAAAAARLLQHAAAGSAASSGMDAAVQDLQAIRRFVASLESLLWSVNDGGCETGSSSSSSGGGTSQSWRSSTAKIAAASECFSSVAGGELLPLRPWWVQLSEAFAEKIGSSGAQKQATGGSLSAALAGHQHANVTAAAAYERAVMAERNTVLTGVLWRAADRAAAAAAVNQVQVQQQQQVVAVVGFNHVPGIQLLWEQRQQQAAAAGGTSSSATPATESGAFLPWQLAATDAAASVLELAAAGGAGLMWLAGVQRWGGGTAAMCAAAGGFSSTSSRLGLLLLPAAAALLPLQREAERMKEACHLLEQVSAVNDRMLRQELQELHDPPSNSAGSGEGGSRGLLQLAFRAQAAAAAGGGGGGIAAA